MVTANNRLRSEYIKLFNSGVNVKISDEQDDALEVIISGPPDTPYRNGRFKIFIKLPPEYPYKSPSVGFGTRIFHPNVDEKSGSICLDVLNQYWSPLYDCTNVVKSFIPLLLSYPNASDPLNSEAAATFIKSREKFNEFVERHVLMHALPLDNEPSKSESTTSSVASDSLDV